jgi:hypothetical protein
MDDRYSTKRMLILRKLTRAAADLLRGDLKEYLAALTPLFRPRVVLGDHVKSNLKETVRGADAAFKELQNLYETAATAPPFGLAKDLKPPLDVMSTTLELAPTEYTYEAKNDREAKTVTVTSPLKWVLHYAGYSPRRLRELLTERDRTGNELQQFVLHYLMLHVVLTRQPGVAKVLRDLHFAVSAGQLEGCGSLPITYLTAAVTTLRPPDAVIIENTEVSGMDVFEEVIQTDDVIALRDPLQVRLLELAKEQGADIRQGG